METTPKNFDTWGNTLQAKKGDMGERIVCDYLQKKGWIMYKSITNAGHCFDFLAIKNESECRIVEVKTKPKRKYYPDTGFEVSQYNRYKKAGKELQCKIFIAFVDEHAGEIYGNYLHELEKEITIIVNGKPVKYPLVQPTYIQYPHKGNTIYFPIQHMKTIKLLESSEIEYLKNHSTRNKLYD